MSSTKVLALVTARGGSKGIPGKNIKMIAGKPLIAWTIEAAIQSSCVDRVVVSTDHVEIAEVSKIWGAEVPFLRPAQLAQDDSPHYLAVEHALDWLEMNQSYVPDYLLLLQPTSPLRQIEDINNVIALIASRHADAVVSVYPIHPHPYLARKMESDGTLTNFITHTLDYAYRQAFPPAYGLNGAIYLIRPDVFRRLHGFLPTGALAYIMPPERSLDIDTVWDFHLAELILKERFENGLH